MSLWRGTREQRACCLVFDTYLKAPMFSLCRSACGGLQLLLVFEGYSLPHPCLQAKLHSYIYLHSFFVFLFSFSPPSSTSSFAQSSFPLSLLLSVSPSLSPLRAAGSGRILLWRSELITCILDRFATWGHTLPEDRSIHAGGNRGAEARGLKPGARSRVGAGSLNCSRSRGETSCMLGQQLHEPEGQGRRKGAQSGVRGRDTEPGGEGRVRVSDRGLHGPAEALLIHGRVELTV